MKEPLKELWAITNDDGEVVYSRGGSSSPRRIMVYPSQQKAEAALNNHWTQQVYGGEKLTIRCIYVALPQGD